MRKHVRETYLLFSIRWAHSWFTYHDLEILNFYHSIENFSSSYKSDSSDYRQLLISEIEDDGVFYCIYDYRTMGRMGQKTRYKFQIEDFKESMNPSDLNIELLDKRMIMIR